ncbi:hypothetical protein GCM10009096_23550 [Parasphingorhabdus litoris]|uniref:Pentapeptide repeat-containing protein n=1 Tax=Parasphingorhabdus litoris TaxID=394733 RepID=A0ABN1ANM7_9SPHN|nr:pentapeptide repeat-containing protein [Parasphingorhabdus litoris]
MLELILAATALGGAEQTEGGTAATVDSCISAAIGPGGIESSSHKRVDGSTIRKLLDLKNVRRRNGRGTAPIVIDGGNFAGWQLKKLKLQNICFVGSDLSGSDWSSVSASGLGFVRSNLAGANLSGAQLTSSLWRESDLSDVNASGANLDGSLVDGGWTGSFARTSFDGALMRGVRFSCGAGETDGCSFNRQGLSLKGTDLRQAQISSFAFWDTDTTGAQLGGATIALNQLPVFNDIQLDRPALLVVGNRQIPVTQDDVSALRQAIRFEEGSSEAPWCLGQNAEPCPVSTSENAALYRDVQRLAAARTGTAANRSKAAFNKARNDCLAKNGDEQTACLVASHWRHREALLSQGGQPEWLDGETIRVYGAGELSIDPALADTRIVEQVAPTLIDQMATLVVLRSDKPGQLQARLRSKDGCAISADDIVYLRRQGRMARPLARRKYRSLFSVSDELLTWSRLSFLDKDKATLQCEDRPMILQRINLPKSVANNLWLQWNQQP